MATNWSGKLYAVKRADGKYDVGITLPTGSTPSSSVLVYDGCGPIPPTGFPQGTVVDDLNAYLEQLHQQGYKFTRSSI